jgi:hypothetical protein
MMSKGVVRIRRRDVETPVHLVEEMALKED